MITGLLVALTIMYMLGFVMTMSYVMTAMAAGVLPKPHHKVAIIIASLFWPLIAAYVSIDVCKAYRELRAWSSK